MIVLSRHNGDRIQIDARAICPQSITGKSLDEIRRIKLISGRLSITIGDLFDVHRNASDCSDIDGVQDIEGEQTESVLIEGDCSDLTHLGAFMCDGTMIIRGDVGRFFGAGMSGGRILVTGDVAGSAAQSMSGGQMLIYGNCGDRLAGPAVGKQAGMRGGDIIVAGNCGDRIAERMRRGTILIGGNAGDFGCARMIAGTVICLGRLGHLWCRGMKRGTLITSRDLPDLRPHQFSSPRDFELSFLPLVWNHLRKSLDDLTALLDTLDCPKEQQTISIPTTRWIRRRVGDIEHDGAGEILILPVRETDKSIL